MLIVDVLIEYASVKLDRPFTYLYNGHELINKGVRVLLTFNNKKIIGYVVNVHSTDKSKEELENGMGINLCYIDKILDQEPLINDELLLLAKKIKDYYLTSYISVLQTMLPSSLNIKRSSLSGPKIAFDEFIKINEEVDFDINDLTPKQKELYLLIKNEKLVNKREIKSKSILNILLKNNIVKIIKKEKRRLKLPRFSQTSEIILTSDQQKVINEFLSSNDKIFLLQGVTGSGKTEIYLNIAKKYILENKGVIILVPEIALTPMMSYRFLQCFNDKVAILHSELTKAEKYDEYRKIAEGEIKVVVGVRSAIFAPIKNLGLIIIDEEHVESYKQDVNPFYHAREVAIFRSDICGAKVLLGSATPSLESKARAEKGIYHFLKLDKRINNKSLPSASIIDLSNFSNIDRDSYLFSLELRKNMQETLNRNEQIILLVNRRGFASSLGCRNCGYIFKCPNCGIALTYHKKENLLKCHHCDYVCDYPSNCPKCGSTYFIKTGFGSERIEEEVNRLFPTCKTLRLDSDSAKIRTKIFKILDDFKNKRADVLIGTQMIAKGHDFQDVTLVGVVLADIGLSLPTFRSAERTFQLITQAVGRSGRSQKEGKAIIQTYSPSHYAIKLAAKQDYENFYKIEMKNRKLTQYPPYVFLCSLSISSKNEDSCINSSFKIRDYLVDRFEKNAQILGPVSPYICFDGRFYKRNILIKYKNQELAHKIIAELISTNNKNTINISINFDPYDF